MSRTHKDQPIGVRWSCIYCGGKFDNHRRPDACNCEARRAGVANWTNGTEVSEWPYKAESWFWYMVPPPRWYVRTFHKANRGHVKNVLRDYEGYVDYDRGYDEPADVYDDGCAKYYWW